MNRIISEELYKDYERLLLLDIEEQDGPTWPEASNKMLDQLRNAPVASGVDLSGVKELLEVQGRDGTWNHDNYLHGMYNGMELVIASLEGREPEYRTLTTPAPAGQVGGDWLQLITLMQEAKVWKSKDVRNSKLDRAISIARSLEYLHVHSNPVSGQVSKEIIEALAADEHDRWSGQARTALDEMTTERRERWDRLSKTPYSELTEEMKELDRKQVRERLAIMNKYHALRTQPQAEVVRTSDIATLSTTAPAGQVGDGLVEGDFVEVVLNKRLGCKLEPGKYCFEFVRFADFNIVVLRDSLTKAEWQPYKSEIDSIRRLEAIRQPVETVGEDRFAEAVKLLRGVYTGAHLPPEWVRWIKDFLAIIDADAIRTQPQAPVVEVPTVEEIEQAIADLDKSFESDFDDETIELEVDYKKAVAKAIHALLSRTGGRHD